MSSKRKFILLLMGVFTASISTWWINSPGYMDADYYFAMGKVLASGGGFSEPFIWNYLSNPTMVTHPAFQYWMPMTSFLAAVSQAIFGVGFRIAQLPFLLLTVMLPVFTAWIAYKMLKDEQLAWQSGLLASVPGLFLPFFVTTDSFSIYVILGPLIFVAIVEAFNEDNFLRWFIPGILAGIAHLTRADGILFLGIGFFAVLYSSQPKVRSLSGLIGGYLLIMGSWWLLNLTLTGSPMAGGASRILWATNYDELFSYPPDKLTFHRWSQSGLGDIFLLRIEALWANLQTLFLVNGVIFLSPFMIIGFWNQRRSLISYLVFFYLVLLLVFMSFVFPFAGSRGGFFHSSAAVMPILWGFAPLGLRIAIEKGVELRNWQREQASEVFVTATLALTAIITLGLFWTRVVGVDYLNSRWSANTRVYEDVANWFKGEDVDRAVVAVNNPPGFFAQSGLQAVVIPDGDDGVLRQVVEKFNVDWVLLDSNNPGLGSLYENPQLFDWLELAEILEDVQGEPLIIFRVNLDRP